MPRDLKDVLHYLLPEIGEPAAPVEAAAAEAPALARAAEPPSAPRAERASAAPPAPRAGTDGRDALPCVSVPIGSSDVVRAAFVWNLAVEVARLGGRVALVVPAELAPEGLWPAAGAGPLGSEIVWAQASDLCGLAREAEQVAQRLARRARQGGLVLVHLPPPWLRTQQAPLELLRWNLLLTSSEGQDLLETYGLAKLIHGCNPNAQLGITIHGIRKLAEARDAFDHLAAAASRHLGRRVTSFGALVDDLDVYRAIVARRPIGLAHPQSPAARALHDVASMLLDRSREIARA